MKTVFMKALILKTVIGKYTKSISIKVLISDHLIPTIIETIEGIITSTLEILSDCPAESELSFEYRK